MRWLAAILGLLLLVLIVGAIWQYMPEARERAEIRKAVKDYLAQQFYKKPANFGHPHLPQLCPCDCLRL
jgi:hypothetical protein